MLKNCRMGRFVASTRCPFLAFMKIRTLDAKRRSEQRGKAGYHPGRNGFFFVPGNRTSLRRCRSSSGITDFFESSVRFRFSAAPTSVVSVGDELNDWQRLSLSHNWADMVWRVRKQPLSLSHPSTHSHTHALTLSLSLSLSLSLTLAHTHAHSKCSWRKRRGNNAKVWRKLSRCF